MANRSTRSVTGDLVRDFIGYRLRRAGYDDWPGLNNNFNFDSPSPIHRAMRMMGDDFYSAYCNAFEDMTGNINIHAADLKDVFFQILDSTCETGINWGRIVGLFVFSAMLAVKAMACGREDVVEDITEWAADYLENDRYSNWINLHGGWDGFVSFHKAPKARIEQNHQLWTKACSGVVSLVSGVVSVANYLKH